MLCIFYNVYKKQIFCTYPQGLTPSWKHKVMPVTIQIKSVNGQAQPLIDFQKRKTTAKYTNYDQVQFFDRPNLSKHGIFRRKYNKGALVERLAGVSTLLSPHYKGCDFVVAEAMLKEKHTPEEKPQGVSGQIPPSHRDKHLGLRWPFLWPIFRAWRQSSSQ